MTRCRTRGPRALLALGILVGVAAPGAAQQTGMRAGPWKVLAQQVDGGHRWLPAAGGTRPTILMVATAGRPPADTLLARYLASQGYEVLRAAGPVDQLVAALSGRSTASGVAVLAYGSGSRTARAIARRLATVRAVIEVAPAADTSSVPPRVALLSFRSSGTSAARGVGADRSAHRLIVLSSAPRRLHPGVIHAFLDYRLRGLGEPLPVLAARLRRAGLEAQVSDAGR